LPEVIILRILDLSITKYFDSLKENIPKRILGLLAKRFWKFRRISVRMEFKGDSEGNLK
jgi:hypothetical protein